MQFRDATIDDIASVAALHTASWRDAYRSIFDAAFLAGPVVQERLDVWTERLIQPDPAQRTILAEEDGKLIGFVCVFARKDAQWGSLVDNLHVRPGERSKGLGRQLLRRGAQWARVTYPAGGLHLWVYEANVAACRFYTRMGGQVVERTDKSTYGGSAPILRYHWPDGVIGE
ncbi:MAG TPA: GNAT family N-acetyltransferase [Hyphomonadaceae bacterium]|jgi:GNAT superfamily N-acetyltransferase|nr:GNAT family N-acetyltransferase [Hyphomonadaceae bacterium]